MKNFFNYYKVVFFLFFLLFVNLLVSSFYKVNFNSKENNFSFEIKIDNYLSPKEVASDDKIIKIIHNLLDKSFDKDSKNDILVDNIMKRSGSGSDSLHNVKNFLVNIKFQNKLKDKNNEQKVVINNILSRIRRSGKILFLSKEGKYDILERDFPKEKDKSSPSEPRKDKKLVFEKLVDKTTSFVDQNTHYSKLIFKIKEKEKTVWNSFIESLKKFEGSDKEQFQEINVILDGAGLLNYYRNNSEESLFNILWSKLTDDEKKLVYAQEGESEDAALKKDEILEVLKSPFFPSWKWKYFYQEHIDESNNNHYLLDSKDNSDLILDDNKIDSGFDGSLLHKLYPILKKLVWDDSINIERGYPGVNDFYLGKLSLSDLKDNKIELLNKNVSYSKNQLNSELINFYLSGNKIYLSSSEILSEGKSNDSLIKQIGIVFLLFFVLIFFFFRYGFFGVIYGLLFFFAFQLSLFFFLNYFFSLFDYSLFVGIFLIVLTLFEIDSLFLSKLKNKYFSFKEKKYQNTVKQKFSKETFSFLHIFKQANGETIGKVLNNFLLLFIFIISLYLFNIFFLKKILLLAGLLVIFFLIFNILIFRLFCFLVSNISNKELILENSDLLFSFRNKTVYHPSLKFQSFGFINNHFYKILFLVLVIITLCFSLFAFSNPISSTLFSSSKLPENEQKVLSFPFNYGYKNLSPNKFNKEIIEEIKDEIIKKNNLNRDDLGIKKDNIIIQNNFSFQDKKNLLVKLYNLDSKKINEIEKMVDSDSYKYFSKNYNSFSMRKVFLSILVISCIFIFFSVFYLQLGLWRNLLFLCGFLLFFFFNYLFFFAIFHFLDLQLILFIFFSNIIYSFIIFLDNIRVLNKWNVKELKKKEQTGENILFDKDEIFLSKIMNRRLFRFNKTFFIFVLLISSLFFHLLPFNYWLFLFCVIFLIDFFITYLTYYCFRITLFHKFFRPKKFKIVKKMSKKIIMQEEYDVKGIND